MIENRYKKHIFKVNIGDHPKFIQNKINSLNESQFGFNAFGLDNYINRSISDYISAYSERFLSEIKLSFNNSYKKENFI